LRKSFLIIILLIIFNNLYCQIGDREKIELYGRVWGEIKYFHPTVQKGKIDWDSVFVKKYNKFKKVSNRSEFNKLIKNLIDTVGRIKVKESNYRKYFPKDTTVNNLEFSWIDNTLLDSANKQDLYNIINYYKPRKSKVYINESTSYSFPDLSQFVGFPDEANSMLALFTYWNRIKYFFAYHDIMDTPWDLTLKEYIPKVQKSSGKKSFYLTIAELITKVNDGHAWCINGQVSNKIGSSLSIRMGYAENRTIITDIPDSISSYLGLNTGDEILEINGVNIDERRKNLGKFIGGSNTNSINSNMNFYILGLKYSEPFVIKVKDRSGIEKIIVSKYDSLLFSKYRKSTKYSENINDPYRLINSKYGYIDAGYSTVRGVHKAFRRFANTEAIIIDTRNYGGAPTYFYSAHLTNKNIPYATLYIGDTKFPGTFKKAIYKTNKFGISFLYKKYKGKVIVLTDENTGSGMELKSMWLRSLDAIIIGRNTGGYDGSCTPFLIKDDFGAAYSRDAVFYPDGSQTQRIGIIPDIYVNKTAKGLINGDDEILESAIKYLEEKSD